MAKNDVPVDVYDKHQLQLVKGCFLLYRADHDVETWVLAPRDEGGEIYLRQKRFGDGWNYWSTKTKSTRMRPSRPKEITSVPKLFCRPGPLSEVMEELKKIGLEEPFVEVCTVRGVWT